MSTLLLKNSNTEVLLACRTCLATERKLYSVHEYNLTQAYTCLIGSKASPYDGLPQYFCNLCATLLLKFNVFKRNTQQVQNYLQDVKIVSSNFLPYHPVLLTQSNITVIDTTENTEIKTAIESKFDDQTDDHISPLLLDNNLISTEKDDITENINNINKEYVKKDDIFKHFEVNIIKNNDNYNESVEILNQKQNKICKYNKNMEKDVNFKHFEQDYNVEVFVLSIEEQKTDMLDRKTSRNYLYSPYKCELCYKGVMDESSLKKHFLNQHDPIRGSIICDMCNFRYKDKRGLNQHIKKSHRLKFVCRQCSYVSRTTFNAKQHYKMHSGHVHKCGHCGKAYEKLSSHLTHLRIHHPSDFIWCDLCGEAFIGRFGLNAHKKRAHRHLNLTYDCSTCETHFSTENAINKHKILKNCKFSSCVYCGESFEKALMLREHLLENHRTLKIYECEKCDKKFSRQSLHSAHYRRVHVEEKKIVKPWVCEVCGKTLPNKCVLLYHQRNHTGERPYQCSQCNKSFTMKRLLQSHLKVHTSDRPYICKLCPKTFKGLSALRSHEHIHSGIKKTSRNRKVQI